MSDNPLIISCCVIGAELTQQDYPYLPCNQEELAEAARGAVEAGASIIHLHVRDGKGKPTQSMDIFRDVSKKIKDRCDCILQYSTGGAVGTSVDDRCAPLKLKPEMATLSMGTLNFGDDIFENSSDTIKTIAKAIYDNGVMPELEIFDYAMWETAERFLKKKLIPEKYHVDFVLGVPGGMSGELRNLVMLVDRLKPTQTWTVAGVGRYQLPLSIHAIGMGGHVRIGIEDNIFYRKGEMARSNAQLIDRVVRISREMDRPIADVSEARKMLGLKP